MSGKLRVHCMTFNVAGMPPPSMGSEEGEKMSEILLNAYAEKSIDIYSIGFQEVHSRLDKYFVDSFVNGEDDWTNFVTKLLAPNGYIRIKTIRVLGIILGIYIHRSHLLHVREIQAQYQRLSLGGYVGLKGAVAIRLKLYGVTLCFVNSHLSAHDYNYDLRISEYNSIIENVKFKHNETTNILYHDYIVWCGDLNFRIDDLSFDDIETLAKVEEFSKILAKDQLNRTRATGSAFYELEEVTPEFAPSYKFYQGGDDYDAKRKPAYTDRILYRCNTYNYENLEFDLDLDQQSYQMHSDIRLSDHRPVSAAFELSHFVRQKLAVATDSKAKAAALLKEPFHMIAFDPIVTFRTPELWSVGKDGKVIYNIKLGEGGYCTSWDWIALFKADFESLTDYCAFTWASSCRRTGIEKSVVLMDSSITIPGSFVLIYFGAQNCVLGMSEIFNISQIATELAEEAFEDQK